MIHDEITDVLLRARIPASTKGFIYIHDALEIMDKDSYYFSGKVCALYTKIAKQHGASFSQVERAIRYAFKGALNLDPVNTQNSNELKVLFLRWKQEMQQTKEISCDNLSACREQIYNEILAEMKALASGIQQAVSNAASPPKAI